MMNSYTSAQFATWQTKVQQTARDELAQQTNCNPNNLTTITTVAIEGNGMRRIQVVATYSPFQTLVSWPGIPDSINLGCTVVMYAIR